MYYTEEIIKEIIEDISHYINISGDLKFSDKCIITIFHQCPFIINANKKGNGISLRMALELFINNEEDIDKLLASKKVKELLKETIGCIKDYYEIPRKYFL